MKRSAIRLNTLLFACLSICVVVAFSPPALAQSVEFKFAHFVEETHPAHIAAKQFASNVEKRTNGQIKIGIYPANSLGSPPEQCEQVKLGAIDMNLPTQGQFEKYVRACMTAQIPFIFDSYETAHQVLDGPAFDWLAKLAAKEGFILLSNWEWGFRNITNNKLPINKPEDVKGLKLRVPPEMHLQATMESLGAVVTKIAFPEVYMALAQNVADGQENPISTIYHQKFYEVQKHLALTQHTYSCMMHVVNPKKWAKLSPEQQKIMREESRAAGQLMRQAIMSEEKDVIAKMEKSGIKVTQPDIAAFKVAVKPAIDKVVAYTGKENT
ncbi:MAG: TRAP transporter substrate-binding protein, partial [Syntrophobacteraceae bacterium]